VSAWWWFFAAVGIALGLLLGVAIAIHLRRDPWR